MVASAMRRWGSIVVRMPPDVPVSAGPDPAHDDLQWYVDELMTHGVRRVHTLAWRDLDDPDAGGSEVHADEFMRRWAADEVRPT